MKPMSGTLGGFLAAARTSDAPLKMADCFTFALANRTTLYFTNSDIPITCDGQIYAANSILVDGLRYKADRTLSVDTQQITISYANASLGDFTSDFSIDFSIPAIGDAGFSSPVSWLLAGGLFDGAQITRKRAYLSSWRAPAVGSIVLFVGRVATIDEIGRVSAKLTVNSDLAFLDIDMPRNLFAATCVWTLYGSGCNAVRADFTSYGVAGAGSTVSKIFWTGANPTFAQGRLVFTSGVNQGLSATVGSVSSGALNLLRPLPNAPTATDAFTIYQGCDHTRGTCSSRFGNLANYRGYDFVPPPVMGI